MIQFSERGSRGFPHKERDQAETDTGQTHMCYIRLWYKWTEGVFLENYFINLT